jgi:uncharacterized SAM-binding protein YcdF (DUF218 family)
MALGVLVLWVPSTPVVSEALRASLERRYPAQRATAVPPGDAIVILGGGVTAAVPPRAYPDLSEAGDRVLHAARLYRARRAPVVVASGGPLPWRPGPPADTPAAADDLLTTWGIPRAAIVAEVQSTTTYENAVHTARLARARGWTRLIVVTSALHMRRAHATFAATGLTIIPAATDFEIIDTRPPSLLDWLPNADALEGSTRAIKEYVGYRVYAWRGWI